MPIELAGRLRAATHELHTEVEHTAFVSELLRGRLGRSGYVRMLRNLHAIYAALEVGLQRHAGHPALAPVVLAGLARTSHLVADLEALHGPGWASDLALVPAAVAYADRLRTLARTAPALLAAHAYVRYLGDLSGGQVLARVVGGALGLPAGVGVTFYDFGGVAAAQALKQSFRRGLDELVDDEPQAEALIVEACAAFARHKTLFEELAASGAALSAPSA